MRETLLVVKIGKDFLGINAKIAKAVVELSEDNFKKTSLISEHIQGAIIYHDKLYPLVDIGKVFSSKSTNPKVGNIAIIIQEGNKACALLIDEILNIEEGEKVEIEGSKSRVFHLKSGFVEEFNFSYLEGVKIPFLKLENKTNNLRKSSNKQLYLVIKLNEQRFGIEAKLIRKIISIENNQNIKLSSTNWISNAFSIDGKVIKTGILNKLLHIPSNKNQYLVILEKDKKRFGVLAEDIVDMIEINSEEISQGVTRSNIINDFIQTKENIIPIISSNFLLQTIDNEATIFDNISYNTPKNRNLKEDHYLVFKINDQKLGIAVKDIKKLVRSENVKITTFGNSSGIIQVDKMLYPIYNLGKENIVSNHSNLDFLLIEKNEKVLAIPISQVEGIVRAINSQTIYSKDQKNKFSKAIIDEHGNVINVINTDNILEDAYGN